jgi:carbonic anhydrase
MRAKIVVPLFLLAVAVPAAAQQQQPTLCRPPDVPNSRQSPIDIVGAVAGRMDSVSMRYPIVRASVVNTGNNIRVNVDRSPVNALTIDTVSLQLEEFHFHWPGEHTIAGDSFPVEIHMVHKSADGRYAVALGTWVRIGAYNAAWATMWRHLPQRNGRPYRMQINIRELFALGSLSEEQVYRYCGSLTTGQHDPGITWLVRNHPIEMSQRQVDQLKRVMGRWTYPTQPLNDRPIRFWIP